MGKRTKRDQIRNGEEPSTRRDTSGKSKTTAAEDSRKEDPVVRSSRSAVQNRISPNTRRVLGISRFLEVELPRQHWTVFHSHFVFARERDDNGQLKPSGTIKHEDGSPVLIKDARTAYAEQITPCPSCYNTTTFVKSTCVPGEPCRPPKTFECEFDYKGLRWRSIKTRPLQVTEVYYHEVLDDEGLKKEEGRKRKWRPREFKREIVTILPDDFTAGMWQEVEAVLAISEGLETEELRCCLEVERRKKELEAAVNPWRPGEIRPGDLFPKRYQVGRFV